jgi:hypothetical protein
LFFILFLGCGGRTHSDDDDTADGDADADADTDADSDADTDGDPDCAGVPLPTSVDMLVLIDNSNSMAQEQANLTQNFGLLLDALVARVDRDGDGVLEEPATNSLHLGVISTDMGTGGFAVQTCRDAIDGDDGILRNAGSGAIAGCDDLYPLFLSFEEGDDPERVSEDFQCVGTLGTGGCGFEQHLKAVRKALTVHRDGANAGFLRDDSLLSILMVTDEEDCSVREDIGNGTDIFNTQLALGPLNLRCYNHGEQYVEQVDEIVYDLWALRPCLDGHLAVAGIVGIPPGTRHPCSLTNMTDADYQCLLDLPEMQQVIDNSAEGRGERLTPSCDEAGLGEAFPPRRIVELIRQLGNRGATSSVHSICEADLQMGQIGAELRRALGVD